MPKVFRPSLKLTKPPTKPNDDSLEDTVITSPLRPPSPVCFVSQNSMAPRSPNFPISKSSVVSSCTKTNIIESIADLDIDSTLLSSGKAKGPSEVKLFVRKKTSRVVSKPTEQLPPYDEPLDRSSVTLRSLLNWVPVNKPPPSYRQDKPNLSTSKEPNTELDSSFSAINKNPDSKLLDQKNFTDDTCVDPLAPQLRLDSDGNIVLDEASLVVGRPETTDMKILRHINEETGILSVNYNSFRSRKPNRVVQWSSRETTRFYRALNTVGTDFYVMAKMFPKRTRRELQRKFKREEKVNPYLVNQALRNRRTYDLSAFLPSSDEEDHKPTLKPTRTRKKRRVKKQKNIDNTGVQDVLKSNPISEQSLLESINRTLNDDNSCTHNQTHLQKHFPKPPSLEKMIADKQIELNQMSDLVGTSYLPSLSPGSSTEYADHKCMKYDLLTLRKDFLGEID